MPRLRYFPLSYDVAGKRVAVVGAGAQALQRLRLLVRSEAQAVLYAADPSPALADFAAEHAIELVAAEPNDGAIKGSALIFAATGNALADLWLARRARAAGVPINVVDRPELSDFALPAIVERAPVAIAISTDGTAPVLAQRLRAAIEALLPPALGRLGELAGALRAAVQATLPAPEQRRRFWHQLFDGPAAEVALAGDLLTARTLAYGALGKAAEEPLRGKVYLVGAGPGAEDLLTLRAQRLLQTADVIVHDRLVPEAVVAMGRRDATRISVGKAKGLPSVSQNEIDALLIRLAQEGKRVVRLKAGDSLVFGRGGEEIQALRAASIAYEVVPGITAALAAAADAAVPLTLRGVASQLVIATAHGAEGAEPEGWEALAASGATVAVYMGKSVADRVVQRLGEAGLSPATPVVAVENAGRPERRLFAGSLSNLADLVARSDVEGPVLILIGPAVAHGDLAAAEPFLAALRAAA